MAFSNPYTKVSIRGPRLLPYFSLQLPMTCHSSWSNSGLLPVTGSFLVCCWGWQWGSWMKLRVCPCSSQVALQRSFKRHWADGWNKHHHPTHFLPSQSCVMPWGAVQWGKAESPMTWSSSISHREQVCLLVDVCKIYRISYWASVIVIFHIMQVGRLELRGWRACRERSEQIH